MHKKTVYEITGNEPLTHDTWRMRLQGDTSAFTAAGQFVNAAIDGLYLRRPLSVCALDEGALTLVYKVVGKGTLAMSRMTAGGRLDLLTGLGNGFTPEKSSRKALLAGGGVGTAPLYELARRLKASGTEVQAVLGFNTAADIILREEFEALGVRVHTATVDGSEGTHGFVTQIMPELDFDYVYCCGPLPMMRAVCEASACSGQYSFEERMGCGFGICMGCTCNTAGGAKRVCKEGPVFHKEEILWQTLR